MAFEYNVPAIMDDFYSDSIIPWEDAIEGDFYNEFGPGNVDWERKIAEDFYNEFYEVDYMPELPIEDQANEEINNDLIDSFADQGFDPEHGVDDPVERKISEDILEDMEEKKDYAPYEPAEVPIEHDHKYDHLPIGDIGERVPEETPRRYDDNLPIGDIKERVPEETPRRYDEDPGESKDWFGNIIDVGRKVLNVSKQVLNVLESEEKVPEGKEVKISDDDLSDISEEKKFDPDTVEEKLNIEPFENENISPEIIENTVLQILREKKNIDKNSSIRNNLDKIMRQAVNDIYKIGNRSDRIDRLQGLLRTMGIAKKNIMEKSDNSDLPLVFEQILDKWYPSIKHLEEAVDVKSLLEDPDVAPHLSNFDLSESELSNAEIDEIRRAFGEDLKFIFEYHALEDFANIVESLRDYVEDNVENSILKEVLLRDVTNREIVKYQKSNITSRLYSTQPLGKYRNLELTSGILENLYDTIKLGLQKPKEMPRQRIDKDIINLLNDELVRYDIRDIDTNELLFINYNYEDDEKELYENLEGVLEKLEDAKGSRQARFTYTPVRIRLQPNEKFQEQVIKSLQEIEKKILEPKGKLKLLKSKIHGYKGKFLKGSLISSERGKIKKDGSREAPLRHILIDENSTLEDIARISNAILAENGEILDNNKDFIMLIQKGITPIGEVYNAILSELHKHHGHSFTITFNPKSDVGGMFLGGGLNIFTKEIPDQLHDVTGFFPREGEISVGGNISNINNNLPFHIKKLLSTPLFDFTNYQ